MKWSIARFPSRSICRSFLQQVERWGSVEGLSRVEAETLLDGRTVRWTGAGCGASWARALADSYGARLVTALTPGSPAP